MRNLQQSYNMTTIDEDEMPPVPAGRNVATTQKPIPENLTIKSHFDSRETIKTKDGGEISYLIKGKEYTRLAIICVHGAGFSGLSFSQFAGGMADDGFIVSFDLRGHGMSTQQGQLSFEQLVADLNECIPLILAKHTKTPLAPGERYNIVLVGHSLGGSLITAVQNPALNVLCLIVIDITEETAIASLSSMDSILRRRPSHFDSHQALVRHYLQSRTLMQATAVRIQIPGLINEKGDVIAHLPNTQPHWSGWFTGLNGRFMSSSAWKLILVSTLEKLDREHEIAMMQGKIAVEVVPGAVHNLHEDQPLRVVTIVQEYLRKLHFTQNLIDVPQDFRSGLTQDEKPDDETLIRDKIAVDEKQ